MSEQDQQRRTPVDQEDVVEVVRRHTPAGTSEVAEAIGIARTSANYHLEQLEDRGAVWSKKVGPTRIWVHPDVMAKPV